MVSARHSYDEGRGAAPEAGETAGIINPEIFLFQLPALWQVNKEKSKANYNTK